MQIKIQFSANLWPCCLGLMILLPGIGWCQSTGKSCGDSLPDMNVKDTLPFMFVKHSQFKARRRNLENNSMNNNGLTKGEILDAIIQESSSGKTHPRMFTYDTTFINELIHKLIADNNSCPPNGVKVSFGAFAPSVVPDSFDNWALKNQIVLIFSGDNTVKNQNFYVYGPSKKLCKLDTALKNKWTKNYLENIVNHKTGNKMGLKQTIDPKDPSDYVNRDQYTDLLDTKTIFYYWSDFYSFMVNERVFQNNLHKSANYTDSIEVDLVSYSVKGLKKNNPNDQIVGYFKNRLHILFGFRHGNNNYKILRHRRKDNGRWGKPQSYTLAGDNGQLCPYNCTN